MRKFLTLAATILLLGFDAAAQSEIQLKQYFEGRFVTLKIDMPATKHGVSIYPERQEPLNYGEYGTRLKQYGSAIRRGEAVMITKIKVKGKHLEFQLGGGGYGTFGDETVTSASVSSTPKSRREKRLEGELKRETDPERRSRLKNELAELRQERSREDVRKAAIAAEADEIRRERIERKALQGGSRFNIHFQRIDSWNLTPEAVIYALRRYVDFSEEETGRSGNRTETVPLTSIGSRVIRVGPPTTFIKEGLSESEVLRLLGQPLTMFKSESISGSMTVYEFRRSEGRVLRAEFIDGVLVHSRVTEPTHVATVLPAQTTH